MSSHPKGNLKVIEYYYSVSGDTKNYQGRYGHAKKQNKINSLIFLFKIRAHNQCYKDWLEIFCIFSNFFCFLEIQQTNKRNPVLSHSCLVMFLGCRKRNRLHALYFFLCNMETKSHLKMVWKFRKQNFGNAWKSHALGLTKYKNIKGNTYMRGGLFHCHLGLDPCTSQWKICLYSGSG